MGVAALGHPGYAAMNVQGFGAGVGRVGPYYEQGNWYRGGAVQMLFIAWFYGEQNQVRPMFPPNTSREDLIRASKSFDLAQHLPPVDWSKALWHLPVQDIIKNVDGPRGIFADAMPVETGGRMIQRAPNDPAWYTRRPVSRRTCSSTCRDSGSCRGTTCRSARTSRSTITCARPPPRRSPTSSGPIIAPVAHCSYTRATADTIVGERSMGDARLDYNEHRLRVLRSVPEGREGDEARHARRRSPITRWASTSGRRRTPGRRPARSR